MGLFSRKHPPADDGRGRGAGTPGGAKLPSEGVGSAENQSLLNELIGEALALWAERKDRQTFAEVIRRTVAGTLLLDITASQIANPAAGLGTGDSLAIASQPDSAGKRLLLAFTDDAALTQYRGAPGVSLPQTAASVFRLANDDYDGVVINAHSPTEFIAYTEEIIENLTDDPESVAALSAATMTRALPYPEYVQAVGDGPVFAGVPETDDGENEDVAAVATGEGGSTYVALGTSPAEILAWDPQFRVRATTLTRCANLVLNGGHEGVVVNPAAPSVIIPADLFRKIFA